MRSGSDATERYYDEGAEDEWSRLDRHRIEFAVTLRTMREFLPPPPASIVDIGGGPGRYSLTLALQGYRVTLVDLSRACLDLAKRKAIENKLNLDDYVHASATDLHELPDESFEASFLMGPLYHLTLEEDRKLAVSETKRILKPNGLIFASVITRYAPIRWTARYEPASSYHLEFVKKVMDTGAWKGTGEAYRFGRADCYFARPSEIKPLMEEEGFETLAIVGCESAVSMVDEKVNELSDELFDLWVDINYRMGKDADAHGAAEHVLYVGHKAKK